MIVDIFWFLHSDFHKEVPDTYNCNVLVCD